MPVWHASHQAQKFKVLSYSYISHVFQRQTLLDKMPHSVIWFQKQDPFDGRQVP